MSETTAEYRVNKDKNTNDLSKDGLRNLIQGNLDLLCRHIKGTVAHQWAGVILLMQFIEYLLKYQIQSNGNEFPQTHNLRKLYGRLTEDDRGRIEACFDELTAYNRQKDPKSFDTIKGFMDRYYNSYTFLRYPVLQENFSTTERYFYVADTFLVLIALMECSDIDFNIPKVRNVQKTIVEKFDKLLKADIRSQKRGKRGTPMVATGDRGIPYTYPTGNSEDY
ncbi:hypothetical protein C6499_22480 [Candidatus Poribacteria bacterium]|nr:MAG: hypothetical protein C6499_22480 [Candidatus Poribacteria bacterium]